MAELLCFRDKINECQIVSEAPPAGQVNIFQKENGQESQQSQAKEKNEEQAKLSKEIDTCNLNCH